MKRILLYLSMLTATLAMHAEGYPYLTFQTSDGTLLSLSVSSLALSVSGTSLVCTNGDGTQTFTLSDLSKMYFSESNETNGTIATKTDNGLAFSSTTATAKMGETFNAPTLTNPYSLSLTWTSSQESVATVDQTGAVTLVAAGTTTITATYEGSDDYEAGSVSYTLTVEEADIVGISDINTANGGIDVYTILGTYAGHYATLDAAAAALGSGIYIMKSGTKTKQINIKR